MEGGFTPCDMSSDIYFLPTIIQYLKDIEKNGDDIEYIKKVNDAFAMCYKYLIHIYFVKSKYIQDDNLDLNDDNYVQNPKFLEKYHIAYTALIFTSFLVELQLFYLTHKNVTDVKRQYSYNTENHQHNNNFRKNFLDETNNRIFKNTLYIDLDNNNGLIDSVKNFCKDLDEYFNNILNKIEIDMVQYLQALNIIDIDVYKIMSPSDVIDVNKKWFSIYTDWKIRFAKHIRSTVNIPVNTIIEKINDIIYDKLSHVEKYIAEGTGFFSWMYLLDTRPGHNNQDHYGSCITSTYIEHYILYRLHHMSKSIKLVLQSKDGNVHRHWDRTQIGVYDRLNNDNKSISHWATQYGNHKFRVFEHEDDGEIWVTHKAFSLYDDKISYFKALVYPIIDSYKQYWKINSGPSITQHEIQFLNKMSVELVTNLDKILIDTDRIQLSINQLNINQVTHDNKVDVVVKNRLVSKNQLEILVEFITNKKFIVPLGNINNAEIRFKQDDEFIDVDKGIKNILTDFVSNYFFSSDDTIFMFLNIIQTLFNNALNIYIDTKGLEKNAIFFIYKGGNVLRLIAQNYLHKQSLAVHMLDKIFNKYFKKSDADFQIYIKNGIHENMEEIRDDICKLTYLLLNKIRNLFFISPDSYFNYFKFDDAYKKDLLENTLNEINSHINDHDNVYRGKQFVKIDMDNISYGEIDPSYEIQKEENNIEYITSNFNTLKNENARQDFSINKPDGDDYIYLTSIPYLHHSVNKYKNIEDTHVQELLYSDINFTNFYISYNKSLEFRIPGNIDITKFDLIRMKLNFRLYYDVDTPQKQYKTRSFAGECIDVSIPHYSTIIDRDFFVDDDINTLNIKTFTYKNNNDDILIFRSYSINYFIKDLEKILYINSLYPWDDTKYKKRLYRSLFLYTILLFNEIESTQLRTDIINNIIHVLETIHTPEMLDNPINIINLIDTNEFDNSHKINNILTKIKQINQTYLDDENRLIKQVLFQNGINNFITTCRDYLETIRIIINDLDKFSLKKGSIKEKELYELSHIGGGKNYYKKKYMKYKIKYNKLFYEKYVQ